MPRTCRSFPVRQACSLRVLPRVQEAALHAGAAPEPLHALVAFIVSECERQLPMAQELLGVDVSLRVVEARVPREVLASVE